MLSETLQPHFLTEVRALLRVGLPIVATQLIQMSMSLVDFLMAGAVSTEDLAGVALGTSLYWPTILLTTGVLFAVTPTVAQLYGANQISRIGSVGRQAGWVALAGAALVISILVNAGPILRFMDVDAAAIPIAVGFLQAQCFGIVALFGYYVLRNVCDGMAFTLIATVISACAVFVKVPLTYLFVFGAFGMDGHGGVGCGISTALVLWFQFFGVALAIQVTRIRTSGIFRRFEKPDFAQIFKLVKLGIPIGFSIFVEVAFFSGILMLTGRLGVASVASHQIAMSIASVSFMVPLGLGMAATIRIGGRIGEENFAGAKHAARTAVVCSTLFGAVVAVVFWALRYQFVGFYTDEADVIELAAHLLLFAAFFQMFDCAQVTMMGALRGYKDVTVPMLCAIVAYWLVGMPIGVTLAFGLFGFDSAGVVGFWWGLLIGLGLASIGVGGRLFSTATKFTDDVRFRNRWLASR